jgi:uncharacterized protein YgbK (DUF1537 family)
MLLTYYGDDFSGSTDVMEALTLGGVPAVLFLEPPSPEALKRFPECKAVGVAGVSRSESPEWMAGNLSGVFRALGQIGAPICHYKVCSTFDSSPTHGSIGKAVEIGREVFGDGAVPMVVGAPVLRRYVLFANLFATVEGVSFRIDRHPTMSRHPVTPMREGDLRVHLAAQTKLATGHVDILALQRAEGLERFREEAGRGAEIVLFDTLDDQSLREAGRAIWESKCAFAAGSSGVEYALLAYWREQGMLPARPEVRDAGAVDPLLVVSGSCSPRTGEQIEWAMRNGFRCIRVNPSAFDEQSICESARTALARGESVVVYSAAGPGDIVDKPGLQQELGLSLGRLTADLVRSSGVRRVVVAGGDTSGRVGQALGITALTMVRPFAPGSPLCRIWAEESWIDGAEILFKGGQVGGVSLFGEVRAGKPVV